jgi:hypothetical protein
MKKVLSLLGLGLLASSSHAQDLVNRIPANAFSVASFKGDQLFSLLSIPEFNSSALGKKLLEEVSREKDKSYTSVTDFGINLNGTLYYYNQKADSINYNCILVPLSDAGKLELLLSDKDRSVISREGNTRMLTTAKDKTVFIWNNELLFMAMGDLQYSFLNDTVRTRPYGIKEVSYSDYYYQNDAAMEETTVTYEVADAEPAIDVAVAAEPAVAEDAAEAVAEAAEAATEAETDYIAADTAVAMVEEPPMIATPPMIEAPPTVQTTEDTYVPDHNMEAYNRDYEKQRVLKQQLALSWTMAYAKALFNRGNASSSILSNPSYLRSRDEKAVATVWVANLPGMYSGLLSIFGGYKYDKMFKGYGSMSARMYLDKKQLRIASDMEVDDQKAKACRNIYDKKINKKFLKYVNSDKLVGFMSYAFDTESYLKELPGTIEQSYGSYFGSYQDEIGIASELFSLLLDEKAVAKVIKGDALLLINGISQKEVTYKTYEYDEDYNAKEIEKKKTETLPDFLFMMSSDDTRLIEKALHYGIRKNVVSLKNNIYALDKKLSKGPFSFYILIRDGIVFCSTSLGDLQKINADQYQGNISKEQKNLLTKHNVTLFFSPKNVAGKIPENEFGNALKLRQFNALLQSTGNVYMKTTGVKDNLITGELVAEVPEGKDNAVKYFMSWLEDASKID